MKITVKANTSGLQANAKKLLSSFRSRKMGYLWRPLAAHMARLYAQEYAKGWPGLHDLSESYVRWKRARGLRLGLLEATGNLKDRLTSPEGPIQRGTNENTLLIGAGEVSSNVTGRGKPRAPIKYPNAVFTGFVAKYPYGETRNSPRKIVGRNFLWRDEYLESVQNKGAEAAHKMAADAFGAGKVTRL